MRFWLVASMVLVGCVPAAAPVTERTMPDPFVATELPPEPEQVTGAERWTAPAEDVEVAPGDVRSGVLFSDAMAQRAAALSVAYTELRRLYQIDIGVWQRIHGIYTRYLILADEEIARWRRQAERTWWEVNGDEVGLVLGLVLGVGVSLGIGAIIAPSWTTD